MNHRWMIAYVAFLLAANLVSGQSQTAESPHKVALDRLHSIVAMPIEDWRFHADIPHPEDSGVDDSSWPSVKNGEAWTAGRACCGAGLRFPRRCTVIA